MISEFDEYGNLLYAGRFENGEKIPPTETLIVLAYIYNVSIDYILCRTDKPEVNR